MCVCMREEMVCECVCVLYNCPTYGALEEMEEKQRHSGSTKEHTSGED